MTSNLIHVISPGYAIAAADDEISDPDGRPAGRFCKIAVNGLAGTIGLGTGRLPLLRAGHAVVMEGASFDEILAALPAPLRQAVRELAGIEAGARAPLIRSAYCIVGFSHRYGRIVAAVLEGRREFEPELVSGFSAPAVDHAGVVDTDSAIAAAQQQQLLLRQQNPMTAGGILTIARIDADGVHVRPVFDLRAGKALRRPADLSATGVAREPEVHQSRSAESVHGRSNPDRRRPGDLPRARLASAARPEGQGLLGRAAIEIELHRGPL
ncbi:MAG: hypothetical protein QOJ54_564 [Aliidongia sp.]|jgi:hypothetical protein|nr:hypothetical protein [Aliidongia sp.]